MPNLAIQTQDASRRSLTMAIARNSSDGRDAQEGGSLTEPAKAAAPAASKGSKAPGIGTNDADDKDAAGKGQANATGEDKKKAAERDRIKIDRSDDRRRLIETPAMAIAKSMRSAHVPVKEHDECVCVWHVIGRVSNAIRVTAGIQKTALMNGLGGSAGRESTAVSSFKDAFQTTRERIAAEGERLTAAPGPAEAKVRPAKASRGHDGYDR